MGHSLGDGIIVTAIAAAIVAYLYFKHMAQQRRLEIVHQERLVAMDKGIPLPELPLDPARVPKPQDPREMLIHGIAWSAMGFGGMAALFMVGPLANGQAVWPLPIPLALLGVGFILYYTLASDRAR